VPKQKNGPLAFFFFPESLFARRLEIGPNREVPFFYYSAVLGRHNEGRGRKINGISLICRNCAAQSCWLVQKCNFDLNINLGCHVRQCALYLSTPLADNPGRITDLDSSSSQLLRPAEIREVIN